MTTPTQYPDAQYEVGGQPALVGYDVMECEEGLLEDMDEHKKPDGTHRVDIVYSRRRTWQVTLKVLSGTDPSDLLAGTPQTFNSVLCNVRNPKRSFTRGPQVITALFVEQAEHLT